MSESRDSRATRLDILLAEAGQVALGAAVAEKFDIYLSLFIRWNERMNLSSIRDEEGILSRHFLESIACARAIPFEVETLLDFGSGGGFPGIPIALCRPEIAVTLAESQGKKAAFLQEAVRVLGIATKVHSQRAELLGSKFDCVTLRAVDRMQQAVEAAARLVNHGGWLALMTTSGEFAKLQSAAGAGYLWSELIPLPSGADRFLALGQRQVSSQV